MASMAPSTVLRYDRDYKDNELGLSTTREQRAELLLETHLADRSQQADEAMIGPLRDSAAERTSGNRESLRYLSVASDLIPPREKES